MPSVDVLTASGELAGTMALDESVFGVQPNVPVMHQVVTAQLGAARRGTQSTRTRAEVSGGGAKPYRQKGTGRARQGSTRAPHWSGGGIALGPKPRSYRQRTPKKMVRLALASALSDRLAEGQVVVVDRWEFTEPRTKDGIAALAALELTGKVLLVVDPDDDVTIKCFRNLPTVQLLMATELNAYDVLCHDAVVFSANVLPGDSSELVAASPDAKAKAAEAKAARTPQPAPAIEPPKRRRRAAAPEPVAADESEAAETEEEIEEDLARGAEAEAEEVAAGAPETAIAAEPEGDRVSEEATAGDASAGDASAGDATTGDATTGEATAAGADEEGDA
ncbi:MAG TPA: 50S ribosomal protein L4 [Acidimicrobiales bacterium]|nr:50S ribosomal protein L4 [Acidimicrobiales bacterium]